MRSQQYLCQERACADGMQFGFSGSTLYMTLVCIIGPLWIWIWFHSFCCIFIQIEVIHSDWNIWLHVNPVIDICKKLKLPQKIVQQKNEVMGTVIFVQPRFMSVKKKSDKPQFKAMSDFHWSIFIIIFLCLTFVIFKLFLSPMWVLLSWTEGYPQFCRFG